MKIDVERIAELARLQLSEGERERMAEELSKIVSWIDQLADVDVSAVSQSPEAQATPLREDEVRPSVSHDAVAANAPAFSGGFFVVPKVIGSE